MSRVSFLAVVALTATGLLANGNTAQAQSSSKLTGLDKLHQQTTAGGKVCMTDHEHGGDGTMASQNGAKAAAIRHWESFTAWEYGKPWGRYSLAAGKKMECKNGGATWVCNVRARPCRSAGR